MWDAANSYSHVAYPALPFPVTKDAARCVLCQQEIHPDADARLVHFAQFVTSTAQAELRAAETTFNEFLTKLLSCQVTRPDTNATIAEIGSEDAALAGRVSQCLASAAQVQESVSLHGNLAPGKINATTFEPSLVSDLKAAAASLATRANQLLGAKASLDAGQLAELNELRSRVVLRDNIEVIRAAVDRKKRVAAYGQAN